MPTIVAHHDIIKGQEHWLRSPKRKELFGPLGITNIRTFSIRRTRSGWPW